MMNLYFLPLCFLLTIQSVSGQMHPVAKESSVQFSTHNFGFRTGGPWLHRKEIFFLIRMTWQNPLFT